MSYGHTRSDTRYNDPIIIHDGGAAPPTGLVRLIHQSSRSVAPRLFLHFSVPGGVGPCSSEDLATGKGLSASPKKTSRIRNFRLARVHNAQQIYFGENQPSGFWTAPDLTRSGQIWIEKKWVKLKTKIYTDISQVKTNDVGKRALNWASNQFAVLSRSA